MLGTAAPSRADVVLSAGAAWTQVYGGGEHEADVPTAAVPDGSGGVIVTGPSHTKHHQFGITTVDYNASGALVWAHGETVPNLGYALEDSLVALDSAGNATVACPSTSSSNNSIFVVATYTPTGTRTRRLEVALPNKLLTFAGLQSYANGDFSVEGSALIPGTNGAGGSAFWLVARYDKAGSLLWSDEYHPAASGSAGNGVDDVAVGGALDSEGNLVVAGFVTDSTDTDESGIAVRKYDPSGAVLDTTIVPEAGNASAQAKALALDSSDNAYVVGYRLDDSYGNQFEAVKLTSDGTVAWQSYYGAVGDRDTPFCVAVDHDGNVIAGGNAEHDGNSSSYVEALLVKWDADGNLVYERGQHKMTSNFSGTFAVFAAAGTDDIWAIDQTTGFGNLPYAGKLIVDKYDGDANLLSEANYDGAKANLGASIVEGGTYDPTTDSLFAICSQNESPNDSDHRPNYNWVTLKY